MMPLLMFASRHNRATCGRVVSFSQCFFSLCSLIKVEQIPSGEVMYTKGAGCQEGTNSFGVAISLLLNNLTG